MRNYVNENKDSIININSKVMMKLNPSTLLSAPLYEVSIGLEPINIKFSKEKIIEVLDFTTSCVKHNEIMLKSLLDKALKKINHEKEKILRPIC